MAQEIERSDKATEEPKDQEPKDEDTEMTEANEEEESENKESTPAPAVVIPTLSEKTIVSPEKLQQLVLMQTFHVDAVKFIDQIHIAIPIITQLLSSKSKAEVLESMEFLVVSYNYKVKLAAVSKLCIAYRTTTNNVF